MTATLLRSLAEIVGPAHCLGGADRAPYVVDGRTPCGIVLPGSADEVARVVRAAAAAGVPVVPWGGGTQMSRGTPPRDGALVVGLRRLGRVLEHEPGDLTATAEAGITLDALQAALGTGGQWLPLDPPAPGSATLGGVLAANAAGPRRQGYGTARDLVIGMRVVAADGQLIRAGGKVVKNVAGYDLVKLYIGSLGTLGIIVDATLKLRPRPEAEGACWATFASLDAAAGAAVILAGSELGPVALTLLDARAADACAPVVGLPAAAAPAVLVAFDGLARAVAWEGEEAARRLRAAGARPSRRSTPAGRCARSERCARRGAFSRARWRSPPWACSRRRSGPTSGQPRRPPRRVGSSSPRSRTRATGSRRSSSPPAARPARPPPRPRCWPRGAMPRGRAAGTSPSSGRRSACARRARCGIPRGRAWISCAG